MYHPTGRGTVPAMGSPSRLWDAGAVPIGPRGPPEVAVCPHCGGTPQRPRGRHRGGGGADPIKTRVGGRREGKCDGGGGTPMGRGDISGALWGHHWGGGTSVGHCGDTGRGGANGSLWPRPRVGAAEPREEPTCAHTRDRGAQLITAISANYSAAERGGGGGDAQRGDTATPPHKQTPQPKFPPNHRVPSARGAPARVRNPSHPPHSPPSHSVPSDYGPVPGRSRCRSPRGAALSGTGR